MKDYVRSKKIKKSKILILNFLFFLACIFSSFVGFANVSYDLEATGNLTLNSQQGIVITNASLATSSGSSTGEILNYARSAMTNRIVLDNNGNSYVIYMVEVKNTTTSDYKFSNLIYDINNSLPDLALYTNRYIVPSILSKSEVLTLFPSENISNLIEINDVLSSNATKKFFVKFSYDQSIVDQNTNTVSSNYTSLDFGMINYNFKKLYNVSYVDIVNNNYPSYKVDGEALSVTFVNNVPNGVAVFAGDVALTSGVDYTYTNGVLTISSNVNSDIEIVREAIYNISYNLDGGTQNQNQITSYNTTHIQEILEPTKIGYTFDGWYLTSGFDGEKITSTEQLIGNSTLFAKWTFNYPNTDLVVSGDGNSITVSAPNIPSDSGINMSSFLGSEFGGVNITNKTITRIDVILTFTTSGGKTHAVNCILSVNGNTIDTKQFSLPGKSTTKREATVSFTGLSIGSEQEFKISNTDNNTNNNATIYGERIVVTLS